VSAEVSLHPSPPPQGVSRHLPLGIWALGLTSLLMDASSELVHALLPVFLTATLGIGMAALGLLEGLAEATSLVTKVFSGWLSDRLGHRKALTVAGYALAAITKPAFPLADSVGPVFAARFVDRIGKGIRGAPRDALVAELVAPPLRGAAYGLRQALDSVGAVLGPLAAVGLMLLFAGDARRVLWFASIPAVLAVLVLVLGVREPARAAPAVGAAARPPIRMADARTLPRTFWRATLLAGLFVVARLPEAFLLVRGHEAGLGTAWVPLLLVAMNVVYAASAYPAGVASDRLGARGLLLAGIGMLLVAHLCLAVAAGPAGVVLGAAAWGLHLGLTQGLFARMVADAVPAALRGTAFGIFGLVSGVATVVGGAAAGALWSLAGPRATFAAAAGLAALGAIACASRHTVAARGGAP
jgi:MFS family permease